ncbi:MAG: hypothetical protein KKA60_07075 [Proteobacteria bacterium]|nr:hypothetical protein [Pseudomonadota bacterium]
MEFLYTTELTIPLYQIALLLSLTTLALLFGRIKMALLIDYLFTVYWGYVLNSSTLMNLGSEMEDWFTIFYLGFGFIIILLALVGFLTHPE